MDFSANTSLIDRAEAIGSVQAAARRLGCAVYLTGAFARDLWLLFGAGIDIGRRTEDVDLAVECADWETFEHLARDLAARGVERIDRRVLHKFRHPNGNEIDLIPFGGVESADRTLVWPPDGDRVMNLLGFAEVLASTIPVRLPGESEVRVVSPAGLGILKVFAWHERGAFQREKDAPDLHAIGKHYLRIRRPALPEEQEALLLERHGFEDQPAGGELLGRDMAALSSEPVQAAVERILERESDPDGALALARAMTPMNPEAGLAFVIALRVGFTAVDRSRGLGFDPGA